MDNVDDIFKSFVSDKLKQLGLKGADESTAKLEESLKKSAIDSKVAAVKRKPSENGFEERSDSDVKPKKEKKNKHKKKKKKKHKEEKKKKKAKDSHDFIRSETSETKESKSINGKLNKKLLVADEDEVVLTEKKTPTCYHDTVTKLKEIENLSLNVKVKMSPLSNVDSEINLAEAVDSKETFTAGKIKKNFQSMQIKNTTDVMTSKIANSQQADAPVSHETVSSKDKNTAVSSSSSALPSSKSESALDGLSIASASTARETPDKTAGMDLVPIASKSLTNVTLQPVVKNKILDSSKSTTESESKTEGDCSKAGSKSETKHKKRHSSRRSYSRSRSRSKSRKRSKRSRRSRSRSKSRRDHHRHRHHRSRSRDRRHRHRHSRHRRQSLSPVITTDDKMKLLEIAKANVLAQHKADLTIHTLTQENKALLRSGGVTVAQLTGICKEIADGKREVSAAPLVSEVTPNAKINHPFQVKEPPSISINLKSAPILPPVNKPISELTKEFPVSSGSHHQRKETKDAVYGKWEPVVKDEAEKVDAVPTEDKSVFPDVEEDNSVLIKDVIAQRVQAAQQLQNNPDNAHAKKTLHDSQQKLNDWTSSQLIPGRFTGSTALQPLPRRELERGQSAWANNKSFNSDKQVEGIGKCLLQKMGWEEGKSLGKSNVGLLEPLKVTVKTDRKGLSSIMEAPAPTVAAKRPKVTTVKDLSGKHPVSALMEICSKRRWPAPDFQLVMDTGPDHSRQFVFKVRVNNCEYKASTSALNKKIAKAEAATSALRGMGLLS